MANLAPSRFEPIVRPIQNFLAMEASGGLVLMAASVVAMIVANSPLFSTYDALLSTPASVRVGDFGIDKALLLWINDGLMAIFFLLVGLELKREVLEGQLSTVRRAVLPAFGAVGGMAAPAAIYATLNWGDASAMKGWAIPSATDIAFALGVLSLLGDRVPTSIKALLLSVAIFDDVGAILIIAVFYTADLSLASLGFAALFVVGLALINRLGVTRLGPYFVLGVPLWIAVLKSGVHATLAGVVIAMFIPVRRGGEEGDAEESPLHQLEHALHPWVAFGVLPIFAFANAGVSVEAFSLADLTNPIPLGIALGLLLGNQIGVFGMSWIAIRAGLAQLPSDVSWRQLHGVSLMCGVGFTMSLFIASLAFEQGATENLGLDRLGILIGSLVSGALGYLALRTASPAASAIDPASKVS